MVAIMSLIEGIEWGRPAGFLLLLWIAAILWRLRRKDAPRILATGTLKIWRSVLGEGATVAAETRRRIPPRAWLWFVGVLASALAIVDVQGRRAPQAPLHVFHLDRSPSMYLHLEPDADKTRYASALDATLEWLDEQSIPDTSREWRTSAGSPVRGAHPPATWATTPYPAHAEVPADLYEDEQLTVITDHSRDSRSGLVASGGASAPGQIAERDGHSLNWDGRLVRPGAPLSDRRVAAGETIPDDLTELLRIWSDERGYSFAPATDCDIVIELGTPPSGDSKSRTVWLPPMPAEERPSDPAFWAVRWSERLDAAMPPRPGIVSLEERQSAGESSFRPGASSGDVPSPRGIPPAAWLAALSLICALGAFWPARAASRQSGAGEMGAGGVGVPL
jgi:hypothetical protein